MVSYVLAVTTNSYKEPLKINRKKSKLGLLEITDTVSLVSESTANNCHLNKFRAVIGRRIIS